MYVGYRNSKIKFKKNYNNNKQGTLHKYICLGNTRKMSNCYHIKICLYEKLYHFKVLIYYEINLRVCCAREYYLLCNLIFYF